LDPLTTVTPHDAHIWYVHRQIGDLFSVGEDSITALFGGDEALRMRIFDSRLQPLLGAR
jgi:hypothetical protein